MERILHFYLEIFSKEVLKIIAEYANSSYTLDECMLFATWHLDGLELKSWLPRAKSNSVFELMHEACRYNRKSAARILIKQGFGDYDSGFRGACEGRNIYLAKMMLQRGIQDSASAFYFAFKSECGDIIELCLRHITLSKVTPYQWSEIWNACKCSVIARHYLNEVYKSVSFERDKQFTTWELNMQSI